MSDRPRRLLCLEGAGAQGLSQLLILQGLMETIDPSNPPKPCQYFDLIGGSSTGGLMVIMLGRLEMSVQDAIAAYLVIAERCFIFERERRGIFGRMRTRFQSNSSAREEQLVRCVKELLGQVNEGPNAQFKRDSSCKTFVMCARPGIEQPQVLRSYRLPTDAIPQATVWEACRATMALNSIFQPITISSSRLTFGAGRPSWNSPLEQLLSESIQLWPDDGPKSKRLVAINVPQATNVIAYPAEVGRTISHIYRACWESPFWQSQDGVDLRDHHSLLPISHRQIGNIRWSMLGQEPLAIADILQSVRDFLDSSETRRTLRAFARRLKSDPVEDADLPLQARYFNRPRSEPAPEQEMKAALVPAQQVPATRTETPPKQPPTHCPPSSEEEDLSSDEESISDIYDAPSVAGSPRSLSIQVQPQPRPEQQPRHEVEDLNTHDTGGVREPPPPPVREPAVYAQRPPSIPALTPAEEALIRHDPRLIDPENSSNALFAAAKGGYMGILHRAIANGGSVQIKDSMGRTPLHVAAQFGKTQCLEFLLTRGADLNARDNFGETPLIRAARGGQSAAACGLLFRPGVDANAADTMGWTALGWAAYKGAGNLVEQLLIDARVPLCENADASPLWWARRRGHSQVARRIEETAARTGAPITRYLTKKLDEENFYANSTSQLDVPVDINGHTLKAMLITGAEGSFINVPCAKETGIYNLLDTRFQGLAKGFQVIRHLGRVHIVNIDVGGVVAMQSLVVMDQPTLTWEVLLGIDFFRRQDAIVEFGENKLQLRGRQDVEYQTLPIYDVRRDFV